MTGSSLPHSMCSLLLSTFLSKAGQCVSCLSHCHYQSDVCLHVHQLRRLCSSIYLARNIRECQQNLTPEIVRTFLLANQSRTPDHHDDDNDEPVSSTYRSSEHVRIVAWPMAAVSTEPTNEWAFWESVQRVCSNPNREEGLESVLVHSSTCSSVCLHFSPCNSLQQTLPADV